MNRTLIDRYGEVGATISSLMKAAEWGDGVAAPLAEYIARTQPGLRGFTRAKALADPADSSNATRSS